jgi:LysM repeat protein
MAAALVMSVGLSTYMSRSAVPVLNEPTMALSAVEVPEVLELSADKEAGWVPLEAPVIASPEELAVDAPVEESAPAHLDVEPANPGASSYAIQVSPAVTMETNSGNKVNYTVQEGDSLWKIAKKHKGKIGVMERIEKIKRDNELNDANLKPGQLLSIYL